MMLSDEYKGRPDEFVSPTVRDVHGRLAHLEKQILELAKQQEEILANQKELLRRIPGPPPIPPDCEYL